MRTVQGSLEDNVLTVLVWSLQHSASVAIQCPPEIFSTRAYQKIAEKAHEFLQKYNEPPQAHIYDLLEPELERGDQGKFIGKILSAMDDLKDRLNIEYVLNELDRFIQTRQLSNAASAALDLLHDGDLEKAREVLLTPVEPPSQDNWVEFADAEGWFNQLEQKPDTIYTTGIEEFTNRGVKLHKKRMFLLIAPMKAGKSWFLTQVARTNLIEHRANVMHISLENPLDEVVQRYTQCFLGLTKDQATRLRTPMFHVAENGIVHFEYHEERDVASLAETGRLVIDNKLAPLRRRGRLRCFWFPSGTFSIGQMSSLLISQKALGFVPDVVILDYADLMQLDRSNIRTSTGWTYVALRGLAGTFDFALVTASQSNRISSTANLVTGNMVSEDWSKMGTVDTGVTYSQTEEEEELGIARLWVDACRTARQKWMCQIIQSYPTGQFCLDSVFMTRSWEEEMKRVTRKNSSNNTSVGDEVDDC